METRWGLFLLSPSSYSSVAWAHVDHGISLGPHPGLHVGNRSLMAALDAGCARTTRPHWYTYALVKGRASYENVSTSLSVFLSFLPVPSPSFSFSFHFTSSSSLSFLRLGTVNYGLHLRIIRTLCLYSSRSTPLREILTVYHYLRIEYFQHCRWGSRWVR